MSAWASRIRWGSLGVMLLVICVRVLSEHARIPWWDTDPFVSPIPETRITPALGMVLDAILVMASVGVVISEWMSGRRIGFVTGAMVVLGAIGVALHGFALHPYGGAGALTGDARSLSIGATWAAAVAAGWALSMVARDRAAMRASAGVLLGIVIPLAAIGVVQVFVEHAQMVRVFDADPTSALIGAGLTPGTAGAAAFERRMRQAEATGPFGLANVFGTVAAAGAVFWGVMAWGAVRARSRTGMWMALVGLACGLAGLWLSGSKGAIVAGAFGGAFLALARISPRVVRDRKWIGAVVGVGLIVAPLGAVAARGVVGERIGELSLLFRAQYAEAAIRIFGEHPVFGVGPGNFKSAYLLAKNPLNPEQVESPHSVMLDWLSSLGFFGAAWGVALIAASAAIGTGVWTNRRDARAEIERKEEVPRGARFMAMIVPIGAGACALLIAGGVVSPERAAALLVGLAAWALVAWWCAGATGFTGWIALGAAGAAAAAIAHGMIEVTPVMPGSAAWWASVGGLAVGARGQSRPRVQLSKDVGWCVVCACLVTWAGMVGVRSVRLFGWEKELREAWAGAADPEAAASADRVRAIGQRLARAWQAEPGFMDVGLEAVRVVHGAKPDARATDAEVLAHVMVEDFPGRADAWIAEANAAGTPMEGWGALVKAAHLDPWSLGLAVRLADVAHEMGLEPAGTEWARRALEIDGLMRLDPLVRLSGEERRRLEGWVGSEKGQGSGDP